MKFKIYAIYFYLNGEERELFVELDANYYPEFVAEIGHAFQDARRFFFSNIAIDFTNVSYYYIEEQNE